MQTIKFNRQESNWYEYTVEVSDDWKEGDDPFEGEITDYSEMPDTNESVSDVEDLEIL
jgi:hypothetical protein